METSRTTKDTKSPWLEAEAPGDAILPGYHLLQRAVQGRVLRALLSDLAGQPELPALFSRLNGIVIRKS